MKPYIKAFASFLIAMTLNQCFLCTLSQDKETIKEETKNNILLLIDNSSSMKKTDPNKLTTVAASMMLDSLDKSCRVNIIAFGGTVLTNGKLLDNLSFASLKRDLESLKFDDGYTDLKEGLEEALIQFQGVEGDKSIIILSDGKEEPKGGNTREHMEGLNSLIVKFRAAKVRINTIGLSDMADMDSLGRISFETGGKYFLCNNPSDLIDIFSKIIGNAEDFYTIANYTTDTREGREKNISLSPYIDEVIIKVASCDNKLPLVDVALEGQNLQPEAYGEKYFLYRVKNSQKSSLKISSLDDNKNLVVVQLKSSEKISMLSAEDNIRIPYNIPLDIAVGLQSGKDIPGLYMIKDENGKIDRLDRSENNTYKFEFKKAADGQYPIMITAFNGENEIVAIKNIDINVTDNPPFDFINFPERVFTGKPIEISLKKLDNTPVDKPLGEIVADRDGASERYPLEWDDSSKLLTASFSLEKAGEYRISACINGITNNHTFSYYLPHELLQADKSPCLTIESVNPVKMLRLKEKAVLNLNIVENITYQKEQITLLDDKGNEVGAFDTTPETKGTISVFITPAAETDNLTLSLQCKENQEAVEGMGEIDTQITGRLVTGIPVYPPFRYFLQEYFWLLQLIVLILAAVLLILLAGYLVYIKIVVNYKFRRKISYEINQGNTEWLTLYLAPSQKDSIVYLKLDAFCNLYTGKEPGNHIGSFELKKAAECPPILSGLIYSCYCAWGKPFYKVFYHSNSTVRQKAVDKYGNQKYETSYEYESRVAIEFHAGVNKGTIKFS